MSTTARPSGDEPSPTATKVPSHLRVMTFGDVIDMVADHEPGGVETILGIVVSAREEDERMSRIIQRQGQQRWTDVTRSLREPLDATQAMPAVQEPLADVSVSGGVSPSKPPAPADGEFTQLSDGGQLTVSDSETVDRRTRGSRRANGRSAPRNRLPSTSTSEEEVARRRMILQWLLSTLICIGFAALLVAQLLGKIDLAGLLS